MIPRLRAAPRLTFAAGGVLCLVGAGAGVLLGTAAAALVQPARPPAPAVAPVVGGSAGPARAGMPVRVVAPARLAIPDIDVDAPVEPIGLTLTGNVDVPRTPAATGWYDLGPSPGQPGDAVIVGHLDTADGDAVFWNLRRLHPGSGIAVTLDDGRVVQFSVRSLTYYPYDAPPPEMYATTGPSQLSLVTCAGRWDPQRQTYLERLVVTALRMG